MAKVDLESEEVNARILYWGIAGSGKKTSLRNVSTKLRPDHRGEMRNVATPLDPSVTYMVLPIELGEIGGVRTRMEMVAVPGAPEQAPTRKQLLDQVDGIVFVVDSHSDRVDENVASLDELRKSLNDYDRSLEEIPLVVQYNKRDLADPFVLEELHRRLGLGGATVFEAIATEGTGLLQTLSTISKKVIRVLRDQRLDGEPMDAEPPKDATLSAEPLAVPTPEVPAPVATAENLDPEDPITAMEEAILGETDDAEAIEAQAHAAQALIDQPWHHGGESTDQQAGARIDSHLSIVSVGEATRADERSVRIPLILGDGEGGTSSLILTIRLDPLIDGDSG